MSTAVWTRLAALDIGCNFLKLMLGFTNQMQPNPYESVSTYLEDRYPDIFMPRSAKRARYGSYSDPVGAGGSRRRRRYSRSFGVRKTGSIRANQFRLPAGAAGMGFTSSSTEILNPVSARGTSRSVVTVPDTYSITSSGTSGGLLYFDPSGTYTNIGGAMTGWTNLSAVFDEYKVNSITITAQLEPSDDPTEPPDMFYIASHDTNNIGTEAEINRQTNAMHHVFTPENPLCKYQFVPFMADGIYNSGLLAAQGKHWRPHTWTDVDAPAQLYGFLFVCELPPGVVRNGILRFDTTWDVSFRYRT